ncbi:MAG TPA: hypothetical protein VFQ61_32560 [Polyangiaceae bacterium]|nr:hypothetical protein [Polyangiaceae bacterium]
MKHANHAGYFRGEGRARRIAIDGLPLILSLLTDSLATKTKALPYDEQTPSFRALLPPRCSPLAPCLMGRHLVRVPHRYTRTSATCGSFSANFLRRSHYLVDTVDLSAPATLAGTDCPKLGPGYSPLPIA